MTQIQKRVLIVDDEMDIQMIIQGCLEEIAGWKTVLASSGEEALAVIKIEVLNGVLLDGILMDVSMPGIDGLTTIKKIQEHCQPQIIPIVLLTARDMRFASIDWQILGITGFILKPFDPMTLVDDICAAFQWI